MVGGLYGVEKKEGRRCNRVDDLYRRVGVGVIDTKVVADRLPTNLGVRSVAMACLAVEDGQGGDEEDDVVESVGLVGQQRGLLLCMNNGYDEEEM